MINKKSRENKELAERCVSNIKRYWNSKGLYPKVWCERVPVQIEGEFSYFTYIIKSDIKLEPVS